MTTSGMKKIDSQGLVLFSCSGANRKADLRWQHEKRMVVRPPFTLYFRNGECRKEEVSPFCLFRGFL